MLLIPKIMGHGGLPPWKPRIRRSPALPEMKTYKPRIIRFKQTYLSTQSNFTRAALAQTFRKSAWEAGFEWPFRAESAALSIIPVTETREAGHGSQSPSHWPARCTAAGGTWAAPAQALDTLLGKVMSCRSARMWVCGWVQLGRASGQAGQTMRS